MMRTLQCKQMELRTWIHTAGGLLISLLLYSLKEMTLDDDENGLISKYLIIGVLSARDHFSHREEIRKSWGSHLNEIPNTKLLFVLGDTDCQIHPADRKSVYSCEKWQIPEKDIVKPIADTFVKFGTLSGGQRQNRHECNTGIGFKVFHSVVIDAFSIREDIIKKTGKNLIILQDAEEILESLKVDKEICKEENGYCVVRLSAPLLLPRGFEGELLLQKSSEEEELCGENFFNNHKGRNLTCDWTKTSTIEFKYLKTRRDAIIEWSSSACCAVSLKFKVTETDALRRHMGGHSKREKLWKEYIEDTRLKIMEEQLQNQDLLMLPLQDTYSNLPTKTRKYILWATENYNSTFVMKVDDDIFVNMKQLKMILDNEDGRDNAWWAQFHYHRSVSLYGKSAYVKYPSLTYPTFPSGSGYILTGTLAHAIASVAASLPAYSGEDVSVGIWVTMAAEDVKTFDVPCWLPNPKCEDTVLQPRG